MIDACLEFAKDLYSSEQRRSDSVANKATNLLGFTGIIGALTVELLNLIISVRAKNYWVSLLLAGIYVAMLAVLFATVWLAFGGRTREKVALPHIDGVFDFQSCLEIEVKRKWLADLISSYKITAKDVNRRVTNVYSAQERLAIAILLLIVLVILSIIALQL